MLYTRLALCTTAPELAIGLYTADLAKISAVPRKLVYGITCTALKGLRRTLTQTQMPTS